MKTRTTLLLVSALACGPSRDQREAERTAYAAMLDVLIEGVRSAHACDADMEEVKTLTEKAQLALRERSLASANLNADAAKLALSRVNSCRARLPSDKEHRAKYLGSHDEWMDACLECASGKICVATDRKLRKLFSEAPEKSDPEQAKQLLETMKRTAVCRKP